MQALVQVVRATPLRRQHRGGTAFRQNSHVDIRLNSPQRQTMRWKIGRLRQFRVLTGMNNPLSLPS
jgi:hypothetical protein